ncbi:Hemolysin C [uncultured Gammaproteobacteria bacterium]
MSEANSGRFPREDEADDQHSLSGQFRIWFRAVLRGRGDVSLRETIEELIEERDEEENSIAASERALLTNILKLRDRAVVDAMVPRADIIALDIETPMVELIGRMAETSHSRLPVYHDTLDEVIGVVHIKDVMMCVSRNEPRELKDLIRPVQIVAPSMPVLDLLIQMRQSRQHMALVVDEFGGIDGLVTIEDLVEEIVGEIKDERVDSAAPVLFARPDGTLIADARLPIEDFELRVGPILADDERDQIDTLGGLVVSLAGRVPGRGELLQHSTGMEFEILDADPRRIKRLRVRNPPPVPAPVGG